MYQDWNQHSLFNRFYQDSYIYIIEFKKNQLSWFFFDLISKGYNQVIWTRNIKHAHFFLSEEAVEEFKAEFISPRKTSIIRLSSIC